MQQKMGAKNRIFVHDFNKKGLTNSEYRCIIMHIIQVRNAQVPKEKHHEKDYCYADGSDADCIRYRRIYLLRR